MHYHGVQAIHAPLLLGLALPLLVRALLPQAVVLLPGCEEWQQVEVLRERDVVVQLLETVRERHERALRGLLEPLEVDD